MAERRRSASLRARITLVATAVVGVTLVLGAVGFVGVLRGALLEEVRASVERDVETLATRVESGALPGLEEEDDDDFFQVQSGSGEVLAASDTVADLPLNLPDGDDDDEQTVRIPDEDAAYLVMSDDVDDTVVIAGRSLENLDETLATVGGLLAGAVPLLIGLVALSMWIVVGRALAPVERMRREVDEVTATNLHRRVADPGRSDEIGRLARTMNGMLDRLDTSQRSQRQFISDASHELKSPLASLRQYAEVARSHPDRIGAAELSDAVLDEGTRLERLVQGMLLLARADERALEVSGRAVDLDDLVLAEARRLRDSTPRNVDATLVGPARIRGDEGLLAQVVRNLADNAARHASGRVALSLGVEDGVVLLAVDDDGPGVPAGERDRVFERFVRLDEARGRDGGGSGLGLAIVREIAQAHGGTVRVTGGALGGARFEVRLPAAPDEL